MEKKHFLVLIALLVGVLGLGNDAAAQEECSTEKVNRTCTLTIDRWYPVTVPTVQMQPGAKVFVKVVHPLRFETLSLDIQGGQAVAGTDQTAGFVAAAVPNLKGLLVQTNIQVYTLNALATDPGLKTSATDSPELSQAKRDILRLQFAMVSTFIDIDLFGKESTTLYAQLNEVLAPISPVLFQLPKPSSPGAPLASRRAPGSSVPDDFPRPWIDGEYDDWRDSMLCELAGQECPSKAVSSVTTLLAKGVNLITALAPCPTSPQSQLISCQLATVQADVAKISNKTEQDSISSRFEQLNEDAAILNADLATITAINKDLGNYFANIVLATSTHTPDPLGEIVDPLDKADKINVHLKKFLGRQATYAVSSINNVATSAASVPTTTQKKPVVAITVLYADPIFEVSTGALFSTLPNRSFANQTLVTQNPGAPPTQGNIVIAQSITRPTVVLFAGANFRLGHNFAWSFDQRRGAVYLTSTVGVNVNNSAAEFGIGPSISWRSLMFSALYDWGHDVRLTQGEFVGMVWCNASGANGSIPKCSGNPPSPSTEKYWRGVFAFGISVRIPTVFGAGH
jgi:hypothetical protein